jgi:hypothetical protein
VTSSLVAAQVAGSEPRAVGWLDVGGSTLFTYAAPGDTNVDGVVDLLDTSNVLSFAGYDLPVAATWLDGDFNYDGLADILDTAAFLSADLYDAGPYRPGAPLDAVAAVPEPASLAAAGGAALGLLAALRRRR